MDLFAVARITGCFGTEGFLKVQPHTHDPSRLKSLKRVFVGRSVEDVLGIDVEDVRFGNRSVLLKLTSVDDRTSSERFVGSYVFVTEPDLCRPPVGSYFVHEIIGCEVTAADGSVVGVVEDVLKFPAQDVWAVRLGKTLHMIPAVKEFIVEVDAANRKIRVNLIEGMLGEGTQDKI